MTKVYVSEKRPINGSFELLTEYSVRSETSQTREESDDTTVQVYIEFKTLNSISELLFNSWRTFGIPEIVELGIVSR